jgi:hypothetical protein
MPSISCERNLRLRAAISSNASRGVDAERIRPAIARHNRALSESTAGQVFESERTVRGSRDLIEKLEHRAVVGSCLIPDKTFTCDSTI